MISILDYKDKTIIQRLLRPGQYERTTYLSKEDTNMIKKYSQA